MVSHLFIAEKPSLAAQVAEARGKQLGVSVNRKSNTHYDVGPDVVTALFGHMYDTAPPEHYDQRYKNWSISDLPIVPSKWAIIPDKEKIGHIRDVQGMIKRADKVVNVGDAAREGQLLIDELLVESGLDPFSDRVLRLWLQDLTEKKRIEALEAMFPNANKRNLYNAAVGRQRADWLLGMNMTRLYTGLARRSGLQQGVISVGRVQTPTLRLVVDRDLEIEKFRAVDHYLPTGRFRHANGVFKASWIIPANWTEGLDHDDRLIDKSVAQRIAEKIAGKQGAISTHETSPKSKSPPGGYDLSAMQKECSSKFGFSAEKTLQVVQSLYEKKVTSYPRSDCQFLPVSIHKDEAPQILDNLKGYGKIGEFAQNANLKLKSPIWNDGKVTDHYAIIPTLEATPSKIAGLDGDERRVFDLVAKRFIAQFFPDHRWDATTVIVTCEGERFKATGKRVTDYGWRTVYGAGPAAGQSAEEEEEEDASGKAKDEDQDLPKMAKADPVQVETSGLDSKRTTPPKRFTEGDLIDAMKSVHKFVKDSEAKKRLKETSGIGTAATRGAIIKQLFNRKFLETKGKFVHSTKLGREVIEVVDDGLSDPAMTALWEGQLEKVEHGELELGVFLSQMAERMRKLVGQLENTTLKITNRGPVIPGVGEVCTACGKGRMVARTVMKGDHKGKSYLSCDAWVADDPNSCKHSVWPADPKKPAVKPMDGHGTTCPKCGVGKLLTRQVQTGAHKGKVFLSCDGWKKDDPKSCDHSQWPDRPEVKAIDGHGKTCTACNKGKMVTRVISKEGPNKGRSVLVCDAYDAKVEGSCRNMEWPTQPMAGHGETCPKCSAGKMMTREFTKDGKVQRFMACSANVRGDASTCQNVVWDNTSPGPSSVPPMKGHGASCPVCKVGKMTTRMIRKEGPNKGKTFLVCDQGKQGDSSTCQHVDWGDQPKSGGGKPAQGGQRSGGLAGGLKRTGARA